MRRLQKKQKKARKKAKETPAEGDVAADGGHVTLTLDEEVVRATSVRFAGKVRAFDCYQDKDDSLKVLCTRSCFQLQAVKCHTFPHFF